MPDEKAKVRAYAFYAFATSIGVIVPLSYLTIFMTENLHYSAALMGATLLIARVIDFIVGLICGGIIEKTNMKWGKYRSWLVVLRFVVFLGCALQFMNTSSLPTVAKMAITIIGYCMLHCSMDFLQTAQFGLLAALAGPDMKMRTDLSVKSAQAMAAANIITSAITLPFIKFLTPYVGNTNAYFVAATLFAAVYVIGATVLSNVAAPYDKPRPKDAVSHAHSLTIKDMINSVVTNDQLLVYVSASILYYIGFMLVSGIATYYFMYVLGNFMLMPVAMTTVTVWGLVASVIGPKIGVKLGKKNAMVVGLFLYALGSLALVFFAKASLIAYIVISCLNSISMYIFTGFAANYIIDASEYGFYKTGKDNRAVAMGLMTMPMKIGMAVGGTIAGFGLSYIGYTAGMTVTPEFISKFMWLFGGVPALFYLLGSLTMLFGYKITDQDAAKYTAANAERLKQMMQEMQPQS